MRALILFRNVMAFILLEAVLTPVDLGLLRYGPARTERTAVAADTVRHGPGGAFQLHDSDSPDAGMAACV
jgi:hypothetical protein